MLATAFGIATACHDEIRPTVPPDHVARLLASSRIGDFSFAGYQEGRPLPSVPVVTDARSFGAKGDGVTGRIQGRSRRRSTRRTTARCFCPKGATSCRDCFQSRGVEWSFAARAQMRRCSSSLDHGRKVSHSSRRAGRSRVRRSRTCARRPTAVTGSSR